MGRHALLAVLVVLVAGALAGPAAGATDVRRPNVLVILTDDWTPRELRHLPNVRRLQREGTTFRQSFVSFPICCPSRASFLTGQYAHNHDVRGNFGGTGGGFYRFRRQGDALPAWLRRAGYRTTFLGKYLNEYGGRDPREVPPGWDDFNGLVDYSTYNMFNWAINRNRRVATFGDARYVELLRVYARDSADDAVRSVPELQRRVAELLPDLTYFGLSRERDYQPDVTNRMADEELRSAIRASDPFFFLFSPIAGHKEEYDKFGGLRTQGAPTPDPRPPARYRRTFDDVELPRDPSFDEADVSDKPRVVSVRPRLSPQLVATTTANLRGKLGAMRAADDGIGRLLATLRRSGELDRTLVVLTSDNGYLQGQHRVDDNKFLPYEPSIRVPLVVRGPGVPRGAVRDDLVFNHDLAPTVLDAAGGRASRTLDGRSWLRAARGGRRIPDRPLGLEALSTALPFKIGVPTFDLQEPYRGSRTRALKHVRYRNGDEELYDLRRDPHELRNVARDPARAGDLQRMRALTRRLARCAGTSCRAPARRAARPAPRSRAQLPVRSAASR